MKRNPRTFLEWIIRKRAQARKASQDACYRERQILKTQACADDATIYATYERDAEYYALTQCLEVYRNFKKRGRT